MSYNDICIAVCYWLIITTFWHEKQFSPPLFFNGTFNQRKNDFKPFFIIDFKTFFPKGILFVTFIFLLCKLLFYSYTSEYTLNTWNRKKLRKLQLQDEFGCLNFLMNAIPDISFKKLKFHFLLHWALPFFILNAFCGT